MYMKFTAEKIEYDKWQLHIQGDVGARNGQFNLSEEFDSLEELKIGMEKFIDSAHPKMEIQNKSILRKPEIGETYYFHYSSGYIGYQVWTNDDEDNELYEMGNCYRSQEEAQRAVDVIRATVRVNRRIEELNEGWVPDWKNVIERKWPLGYMHSAKKFGVGCLCTYQEKQYLAVMKSELIARKIITEMHDDLCTIWGIEKEVSK